MSTIAIFDGGGNPISAVTPEHLGMDGSPELFDAEGYRIPGCEIPDALLFPAAFEPTPEEADEGSLALADAALKRAIRAAREVVWAACCDFDDGRRMPPMTNRAIGVLDDALTALETIASVGGAPAEDWRARIDRFNRERTDAPAPGGISDAEAGMLAAGLPVG